MSRPCQAHHPEPLAQPYPECRACWLWAHDAGHRSAWGGDPAEAVPAPDPWAGRLAAAPATAPASRPAAAPRPPGVGDHLAAILKALGFRDDAGCGSCGSLRGEMNRLGPAGVRRDFDRLAGLLRAKQQALGWGATLRAAGRAVAGGMTFLAPNDVAGSLLTEAIRRAEARG